MVDILRGDCRFGLSFPWVSLFARPREETAVSFLTNCAV